MRSTGHRLPAWIGAGTRPDRLNALSWPLVDGLRDALARAAADPAVAAIVVTGAGRAFSAGADLRDLATVSPHELFDHVETHMDASSTPLAVALTTCPVPVVVAVNGLAVIGRPHSEFGESVVAIVTPRRGDTVTLDEVKAFLGDRISRYKIPHDLVVASIPRNASGKILKHVLRGTVEETVSRRSARSRCTGARCRRRVLRRRRRR